MRWTKFKSQSNKRTTEDSDKANKVLHKRCYVYLIAGYNYEGFS